jgi:hypothetical protein
VIYPFSADPRYRLKKEYLQEATGTFQEGIRQGIFVTAAAHRVGQERREWRKGDAISGWHFATCLQGIFSRVIPGVL